MPYRSRHRIGIVGMYKSGKTVFLTSLINHLRDHDPNRLPLGDGRLRLEWLGELPPDEPFGEFPYDRNRNRMGGHLWPVDTLDVSEYRCLLQPVGRRSQLELSLVDFPGERLADTIMAGRSFAEWSDTLLAHFRETAEYQSATAPYFATLETVARPESTPFPSTPSPGTPRQGRGEGSAPPASEQGGHSPASPTTDPNSIGNRQSAIPNPPSPEPLLLESYRRTLLTLITHFLPLVTPSRFLISPQGQHAAEDQSDLLITTGVSGLDAAHQFAPLPPDLRQSHPDLTARFAAHYDAYKLQVVDPLTDWFRRCDALAVLIDPTMLLAGGVGMFNGQQQMLQHLLSYLNPGQGGLTRLLDRTTRTLSLGRYDANDLLRPLNPLARAVANTTLRFPSVRRLAFVATKLDKAHEQDRTKVDHLLRDMTRKLVRVANPNHLRTDFFSTAAVNSTESLDYPYLEGRLEQDGPDAPPKRFKVSPVPDHWPESWPPLQYVYPNVIPSIPARRDAPPRQLGLDRVLTFLLELP